MAGPAPTTLSNNTGPFRRAGPLQRVWLALFNNALKQRTKSSHGRLFAIHVVLEGLAVQSGGYECAYLALRQRPWHLPGRVRFLTSARDEQEQAANGGPV